MNIADDLSSEEKNTLTSFAIGVDQILPSTWNGQLTSSSSILRVPASSETRKERRELQSDLQFILLLLDPTKILSPTNNNPPIMLDPDLIRGDCYQRGDC